MITQTDLKAMSSDEVAVAARDKIRNVATLFRSNSEQARQLREAARCVSELLKRTGESAPDDILYLSPREARTAWADIAAINAMLGNDGWEEGDDATGAELAQAIHEIGARLITHQEIPTAVRVGVWNEVLKLGDKLGRTLHPRTPNQMRAGHDTAPLTMEELHGVLHTANEEMYHRMHDLDVTKAEVRKLKKQRKQFRKYVGRIVKQVSP